MKPTLFNRALLKGLSSPDGSLRALCISQWPRSLPITPIMIMTPAGFSLLLSFLFLSSSQSSTKPNPHFQVYPSRWFPPFPVPKKVALTYNIHLYPTPEENWREYRSHLLLFKMHKEETEVHDTLHRNQSDPCLRAPTKTWGVRPLGGWGGKWAGLVYYTPRENPYNTWKLESFPISSNN